MVNYSLIYTGGHNEVLWMGRPLDCRPSSVPLYLDIVRDIIQDGLRFKKENFINLGQYEWRNFWRAYGREYGPEHRDAKAPSGVFAGLRKRLGLS